MVFVVEHLHHFAGFFPLSTSQGWSFQDHFSWQCCRVLILTTTPWNSKNAILDLRGKTREFCAFSLLESRKKSFINHKMTGTKPFLKRFEFGSKHAIKEIFQGYFDLTHKLT